MIGRYEVAWLHAREETCESNEECQKLTDRRLELYGQIDRDMESLGGYMPEGDAINMAESLCGECFPQPSGVFAWIDK